MEFSTQEYWSGLPFPSPGDLPDPGIEPSLLALQADSLPLGLRRRGGASLSRMRSFCASPQGLGLPQVPFSRPLSPLVTSDHQLLLYTPLLESRLWLDSLPGACARRYSRGERSPWLPLETRPVPGLGRPPGEGNGYPLQFSCVENSMDRGAWEALTWRERAG